MVRNANSDSGYTSSMKLRGPDSPTVSPGSYSKKKLTSSGRSKSPAAGRISSRTWSPGQATLVRRKKIEGDSILGGDEDDEVDYLKLLSAKPKRSGRRPPSSKSIDASSTRRSQPSKSTDDSDLKKSSRVRGPPRKSKSTGSSRYSSAKSTSPTRRREKSDGSSSRRQMKSTSPGTQARRKLKSKSLERRRPPMNQKDIPLAIQKKLYRVTDPELSIKERVELELEFMKGTPEEKRIYLEYRHFFDRQEFFDARAEDEEEKQEKIEANAREEKLKEMEFQKSVERKRQKERQEEEDRKERERQAVKQANLWASETIANTMSDLKNSALEAATVSVARNQHEKKSYEEERRQMVENFRKTDGKDMADVERALKEAVLEQEDPEEKRLRLRGNRPYRER